MLTVEYEPSPITFPKIKSSGFFLSCVELLRLSFEASPGASWLVGVTGGLVPTGPSWNETN